MFPSPLYHSLALRRSCHCLEALFLSRTMETLKIHTSEVSLRTKWDVFVKLLAQSTPLGNDSLRICNSLNFSLCDLSARSGLVDTFSWETLSAVTAPASGPQGPLHALSAPSHTDSQVGTACYEAKQNREEVVILSSDPFSMCLLLFFFILSR